MFDINGIKTLDVFSFEKKGEQTGLGLVINGIPYLLWTHVYQNLEISPKHAMDAISRLEKGNHFISMLNNDFKQLKNRFTVTVNPGYSTSIYHFVTREGYNRVIMEVDTSRMKDKVIAAKIETRKNLMAEIFTKFETGTLVLPVPKNHTRTLPGGYIAIAPIFKDCKAVARGLGFPTQTANLMALEQTQQITGRDMGFYIQAIHYLPAIHDEKRFCSSAVAEAFGISRNRSNRFLADNGLVEPFGNEWILTDLGKKWGVMEPTTITSGGQIKIRYSPKWSPDVIGYLRKKNPVKGQKQIT
jgi:hypothetical protein